MLKVVLFITTLLILSQAEDPIWEGWNNYATLNPSVIQSYPYPAIPFNYISRYSDNSLIPTTYSTRQNQYRYSFRQGPLQCNIYCGLRSFLSVDGQGNLICKRDMSSQFWGNFGTKYNSQCIPDIDKSPYCASKFPVLANVGACDNAKYQNTVYNTSQCCYTDAMLNLPYDDLTTRYQTTSLYALRTSE